MMEHDVSGGSSCRRTPNGRVLKLANTDNCGDDDRTETDAVVNRSFDAVNLNSDTGSCGIVADVHRSEIPPFD